MKTLVDDENYNYLIQWKWTYNKRSKRPLRYDVKTKKTVYMHREILIAKKGEEVDHMNRDGMDNRKENLRKITHQQNMFNRGAVKKRYKGIWRRKEKWNACIKKNNKTTHLGSFFSKEEAAMAYNEAARRLHGEYAYQNCINSLTGHHNP